MSEYKGPLRQGDVFIEKIDPKKISWEGLNRRPNKVVATGEHSGHSHVLSDNAEIFDEGNHTSSICYLRIAGQDDATLTHVTTNSDIPPDHAPLSIPPGEYKVRLQREHTPEYKNPRPRPSYD